MTSGRLTGVRAIVTGSSRGIGRSTALAFAEEGADVIVYTGFGYKGRNVINIRSADIVIIFGGATGTLNEFTIAYDEGKIIGVLEGSGGVADHIREIIDFCNKPSRGVVLFDNNPETLVHRCLEAWSDREKVLSS